MASKPARQSEEPEGSKPRRQRLSRELPPSLSDLLNQLISAAASFIQRFDSSEDQIRQTAEDFRKVAEEVKNMQIKTDSRRITGAVIGGATLVAGAILATGLITVTGGASLIAFCISVGGAGVAQANIQKLLFTKEKAEYIEKLGKDFLELIEPLKEKLEEIKILCETLEEESSKVQAEHALKDVREFQMILRKVSELKDRSKGPYFHAVTLMEKIGAMLLVLINIFTITASPEEDEKLRDSIIQSGDQCQKVTDEFAGLKDELHKFNMD